HNSGPDHWQSRWHEHFPYWQRMTGLPWEKPDLTVWSAKLASKLRSRRSRVHLVAHSFGALTAIAAARLQPEKVASLFLVAPADPARVGIVDERLEGPLQVSAQLVASRNDPWMSFERAEYWSRQWQVPLF
ncbi:RBBP9/YdeN family alpha/beta hydrolase, partial [Aeromonas hydrophila]|uniref:RBBP9/YdeN family alpha/beta hydrolase n=1 Tax=Aeromonas hydrophila TaxID=644 RepID=UPI0036DA9149